jgi:hypothetical protein
MRSTIEYPICFGVALLLALTPRPLGVAPKWQLYGLIGGSLCCGWVIGRTHVRQGEIDQDQHQYEEVGKREAEAAAEAARVEAERARLAELHQADVEQIEAEVTERLHGQIQKLKALAEQLAQERNQFEADQAAFAALMQQQQQEPTPEEKGKAQAQKMIFAMRQAALIDEAKLEIEAQIAQKRRELGLVGGDTQGLDTNAILMEILNRLPGTGARTQTVTVAARAVQPQSATQPTGGHLNPQTFAPDPSYTPVSPSPTAAKVGHDPTDFAIEVQ